MQNNTNTTFAKMTSTFLPPALATVVKKTNNWQFYSSNNLHFFKGCHKIYNFVLIYRQILEASKRRKRKEKQFQLQIFGLWCWLVGWRKNAFCQYWVVTGCLNILNIGFGHENSVQIWILSIFLCTSSSFEFSWLQRQVFVLAISSHPSYLDADWSI